MIINRTNMIALSEYFDLLNNQSAMEWLNWSIVMIHQRLLDSFQLRLRKRNGLFDYQPAQTFSAGGCGQLTTEAIVVKILWQQWTQIHPSLQCNALIDLRNSVQNGHQPRIFCANLEHHSDNRQIASIVAVDEMRFQRKFPPLNLVFTGCMEVILLQTEGFTIQHKVIFILNIHLQRMAVINQDLCSCMQVQR